MNVRPADPPDAPAIRAVAEAAWWDAYPGVLDTDSVRAAVDDLYDVDFLREVLAERDDLLFLVAEEADGEDGETDAAHDEEIDGEEHDEATGRERRDETRAGDGDVRGFVSAQQTWADEVEINALYVHPDRWGEGTGTALLAAVEDAARAAGADRLRAGVISGNSVGRAFFETRGFERVETLAAEVGDETVPEDAFEKAL